MSGGFVLDTARWRKKGWFFELGIAKWGFREGIGFREGQGFFLLGQNTIIGFHLLTIWKAIPVKKCVKEQRHLS